MQGRGDAREFPQHIFPELAPPSSARPKKGARKLAREQLALAAMPPKRPLRACPLLRRRAPRAPPDERPHLITHLSPAEVMEALRAEFEAFDAEGLAKYEALVQQDVERFRRECARSAGSTRPS